MGIPLRGVRPLGLHTQKRGVARVRVYASIAAADPLRLAEAVNQAAELGAERIHVDLQDGVAVPSLTFGPAVARAIARLGRLPVDVHIMALRPEALVEELAGSGVARVAVQVEFCPYPFRLLERIAALGMEPGLALLAATPVDAIRHVLPVASHLLLLTADEQVGGARLVASSLEKAREVRSIVGHAVGVEVIADGAVSLSTAAQIAAAGFDGAVVGRGLFQASTEEARRLIQSLQAVP